MGRGGHGHDHGNGHSHHASHDHHEDPIKETKKVRAKLILATVFAFIFMCIEIAGGYFAGSLAIVTDAAHLFTDIANFITAILASHLAIQPASVTLSYGMVRAEVLSALINTAVIVVLAAFLSYEGIRRIMACINGTADPINGELMMIIAIIGMIFNLCLIFIFGHDHDHGHGGHGHSHGHSHSHSLSHSDYAANGHDEEQGHHHEHEEGKGKDHSDHGHDHDHHDHDHDEEDHHGHHHHNHSSEKKQLLATNGAGYGATDHHHDHGHDHGAHDHKGHHHASHDGGKKKKAKNINLEAAHLHVLTDLLQSIGVAIAGIIIYFRPDYQIVDPICTILFSILIVYSTIKMLQKSTHVLLEGVPEGVDPEFLRQRLKAIDGVTNVHDLHVWMLSIDRPLVTVHLKAADPAKAMKAAHEIFLKAGIKHCTVQVQQDDCSPAECDHPCVSKSCATNTCS